MTEPRREYDEATKGAVMSALLAGQSVSEVADKYRIPAGTVKSWKNRQKDTPVATVATEKRQRIGDLILEGLEAQLTATKAMADVFADKDWIKKQTASEIAILFGVISDKTYRILEALPDSEEAE